MNLPDEATMRVLSDVFKMSMAQAHEHIVTDTVRDHLGNEYAIVRDNLAAVSDPAHCVLFKSDKTTIEGGNVQAESAIKELRNRRVIQAIIGAYNP